MGEGRGNFWLYVLFYSIMPTIEDLKQEISKNTKNRESIAGSWGKIQVLTLSYIWLHFKKLDEYHIQWKQKLPSMCQRYFRDTQAEIYAKSTSQRFKLLLRNGILDCLRLLYIRFMLRTSKLIMVVENLNFINAIFDKTPTSAKKGGE